MHEAEDRRLVERCLAGDLRAFEEIVTRYEGVLFNVALRMLNSHEDAMDVTQTTFLKAYRQLGSYRPEYKFFSWLYRIQMNETLNWIKRRRPTVELSSDLASGAPDPGEDFRRRRTAASVQAAVMELPVPLRQLVVLRHFAGLSYQDIGETLDLPAKTVKARLFEARRRLRDILIRHGMVRT